MGFHSKMAYLQPLLDHSRKYPQLQQGPDPTICKPASLTILESSPSYSKAQVRISEGKYHQVKKMFLAIGVKVMTLKRLSFGPFTLDPQLAPGESRPLNEVELTWVKDSLEKTR